MPKAPRRSFQSWASQISTTWKRAIAIWSIHRATSLRIQPICRCKPTVSLEVGCQILQLRMLGIITSSVTNQLEAYQTWACSLQRKERLLIRIRLAFLTRWASMFQISRMLIVTSIQRIKLSPQTSSKVEYLSRRLSSKLKREMLSKSSSKIKSRDYMRKVKACWTWSKEPSLRLSHQPIRSLLNRKRPQSTSQMVSRFLGSTLRLESTIQRDFQHYVDSTLAHT